MRLLMQGEKSRGWAGEGEEQYLASVSEGRREKSHQGGRGQAAGNRERWKARTGKNISWNQSINIYCKA